MTKWYSKKVSMPLIYLGLFSIMIAGFLFNLLIGWLKSNSGAPSLSGASVAFAILGACLAYKGLNKNRILKKLLSDSINSDENRMDEILAGGKEGELAVNNAINELRQCMDFIHTSKTWMPSDDGIQDIVIDNGKGSLSQEIDSLLVTGNKVFVIEVKDWKGEISVKDGVPYINGTIIDRQEPMLQTKPKVKNLDDLINYQEVEGKRNHFEDIGCNSHDLI